MFYFNLWLFVYVFILQYVRNGFLLLDRVVRNIFLNSHCIDWNGMAANCVWNNV